MNRFKKFLGMGIGATVALSTAMIVGLAGNASALACFQYDPNGFPTSQTPVFNNICNVTSPLSSTQGNYPLGDEPNFVRIRSNTSGSPLGSSNPPLVNSLDAACNNGDKFDIWTYVHNDAEPQFNDNGNGTAVAHNVRLATSAPVNATGNKFSFSSTVSASNAAAVSDNTSLNCNGQPVKLTLVPGSVRFNNDLSQTTYGNLSDSLVNGSTAMGNPVWQSGNVNGCWEFRTVIVYQVTVQKVTPPPPQVTAMCDLFTVEASDNRKVTVNQFKFTATNAVFKSVALDWGDNNSDTLTDSSKVIGTTHTYAADGTYNINAVITFSVAGKPDITSGGAGTACAQQVKFSSTTPPTVTTPPSSTPAAPTSLVNTGPGGIVGMFAAATAFGAAAYRRVLSRRLSL